MPVELNSLVVAAHVLGAFAFVLGHGSSVAAAFRVRRERDPARISAVLETSSWGISLMYIGFLVLLASGITSAFLGSKWGEAWLWWSIGILIAVMVAMYFIAMPYYLGLRHLTGAHINPGQRALAEKYAARGTGLAGLATSWRPQALGAVGGIGLAAIVVLMVLKPG